VKLLAILYIKELKDNKNAFSFLLIATAVTGLYAVTRDGGALVFSSALSLLPYGSVLIMPFVLAHSFANEWKTHTNYQLLALPVPRWQIGLSKVAAVLSVSTAVCALATGAFHWISFEVAQLGFLHGARLSGVDIWVLGGLGYHSILLLLLGVACVMEGTKCALHRYRGLATMGVFIGCFWLYFKLAGVVRETLGETSTYTLQIAVDHGPEHLDTSLSWMLYTGFMGLVFLGLGLWLFGKYVEVE
jgi:hypothetical protein